MNWCNPSETGDRKRKKNHSGILSAQIGGGFYVKFKYWCTYTKKNVSENEFAVHVEAVNGEIFAPRHLACPQI